jgi:hypothetical protein
LYAGRFAEGVQCVKVGLVFSMGILSANLQGGCHGTVLYGKGFQADVDPLDGLESEKQCMSIQTFNIPPS